MRIYSTFFVSIVSLLIIANLLNNTGYFKKAVYTLMLASEGNCFRFYFGIIVFTVFTVFIFNNICIALVFIPVLYEVLEETEFEYDMIIMFLCSVLIISDISSVCFINSNIVNLLYAEKFHITFNQYTDRMLLTGMLGIILCTFFLYLTSKNKMKYRFKTENIKNPDDMIKDWTLLNIEIFILFLMCISYFLFSHIGNNYSLISFSGLVILLVFYFCREGNNTIHQNKIQNKTIFLLLLIMTALILADNSGMKFLNAVNINAAVSGKDMMLLILGGIEVVLSFIFNSIPVSIINIFLIDKTGVLPVLKSNYIYFSILLSDIGPIILPSGSISIILFFKFLKSRGINIKYSEYIKISLKVVIPTLLFVIPLFLLHII